MQGALFDVVVDTVRELTPRVREYRLRSADGRTLPPYSPGAHIELHARTEVHGPMVRHYSLIGGSRLEDDAPNVYRIAVQREDRQRGSAHIHQNFVVGTPVRISRAKNGFPLDFRDRRSLLIAGGIGVTPIYSMARSLVRRKRDFHMVYCGRTPEQLAYSADLEALCEGRVAFHYSGDPPLENVDMVALLEREPQEARVYVCGPPSMINAVHAAAESLGWAEGRIRSERFGVGPAAGDRPFDVHLRRDGRVVPVGRDISILDALSSAGVDLFSDCRRGECGLCAVNVADAGDGIDHRDSYFSADEHQENKSMCICVSRARGERLILDL
ncbi:PDR/VanB family oxidoreductase [Sphingomonas bisphenolicum]|uniref:Vanillate O-demethylase oxidoreductase n=1 Tax=Sphingomonas bisphenolicum TaxID=296544 RepID=A0ABM7G458_9SPHN|nr:PDR/VanB family oxidoreductase [Sphingomonas bisphenolicum]BBF72019.1 vanillate O-demethylase oxidoreductase [Sphingomonas bisphenolicum]